jgi:hypothetical protein
VAVTAALFLWAFFSLDPWPRLLTRNHPRLKLSLTKIFGAKRWCAPKAAVDKSLWTGPPSHTHFRDIEISSAQVECRSDETCIDFFVNTLKADFRWRSLCLSLLTPASTTDAAGQTEVAGRDK